MSSTVENYFASFFASRFERRSQVMQAPQMQDLGRPGRLPGFRDAAMCRACSERCCGVDLSQRFLAKAAPADSFFFMLDRIPYVR